MVDLSKVPSSPGVYIYKNISGKIIYIGKAVNLKKRVSQYFQSDHALGYKTNRLVSEISTLDFHVVGSEIEALILESSLIKQYRPKFNSQLKDDKSYIYITITKDKFPLVKPAFKSTLNQDNLFFGPFPDSRSVKSLLKTIRIIFPYYSRRHEQRTCLYCHLGLCPGPNPDPKEYRRNISNIKKILNGHFKKLINQLTKDMSTFSKNENYELAKIRRDQINSLNYVISGWKSLSHLYQEIDFKEDKYQKATDQLILTLSTNFPQLKKINRIEAYDISNLGTKVFVGAMTVFQNGKIDNSQYRQFKIESKVTPDDQFMIKEIIYRRLKHPEWGIPDLIVVDGGKPQVSAAIAAVETFCKTSLQNNSDLRSTIYDLTSIIGLAKKFETIVIKTSDQDRNLPTDWREINLPKNSPALQLLQQLRNEAHRFSNRYRKKVLKNNLKL